ncbi:Hpt domain-containing protein [Uliginosibacterium sp. sgz301328]|uniref:Hpt domain-containing protein n=1 Tax=Uliginosibacterium sp. sgz301328 TaxID=3243764 RepID=UPI00359D666C
MSFSNEFDVGPLTWVKSEIDAALGRARESLADAQQRPEEREPLRFAQSHVHQASGALSVVGLDGVTQYADAIDKLLAALAAADGTVPADKLTLANRGIAVLANYINELLAGAPHQPLRLYPIYKELVAARGGDVPPPSELFFPDLSRRPALGDAPSIDPARAAHEARVQRGRFEKGLLQWIRQPGANAGPLEMLRAVQHIEQIQTTPATRSFWWAAVAFFEGLASGAIPGDRQAHRLCRRIDTQMRRLIEGSQVIAERLVRDVLYFVATSRIDTPHAQSVRHVYRLDNALPASDAELSDTLRAPLALQLREALENAKEMWNRFCAGAAVALPQFQEQLVEVVARAAPLNVRDVDRLLASMSELLTWLRADPLRHSDTLAMEVATGLLIVEQAAESAVVDPTQLRRQTDALCHQYALRIQGQNPAPLDESQFGSASQRAQEKLFFNQLAREILANLGQIEQTLDIYFRNTAQREPLAALANPLKQIEGALAILGEAEATELVRSSAVEVSRFATAETPPEQSDFDALAHKLSALGFYIEALKHGPARLEFFLNPEAARAAREEVSAVSATVEAQLARDTRETQTLAAALSESPQDTTLRQQLVSNLEAIREDAQLVADSQLEQQTKEAIASLKAGGNVAVEQIQEALSSVAPVSAPQPSAEAARLMSASTEELDAELLEIFLEEAQEVLGTLATSRDEAARESHNLEALTTVRRAYHTLKGSSRMVGLTDFSEAARHVEMAMNRWLQLERDADGEILALIDDGRAVFGAWVEQLLAGGGTWHDASALIAHADRLLASLDPSVDDLPAAPPTAAAIAAAPATASVAAAVAPAFNASAPLDFVLDDMEPSAQPVADAHAIEASLNETRFDLDDFLLPELGTEHHYESSLEETRLDMPALAAFGLDIDLPDMPANSHGKELDLTATLSENDIRALVDDARMPEFDLAATTINPFGNAKAVDIPTLHSLTDRTPETTIGLDSHGDADLTVTPISLETLAGEAANDESDLTTTALNVEDLLEPLPEPLTLNEPIIADAVAGSNDAAMEDGLVATALNVDEWLDDAPAKDAVAEDLPIVDEDEAGIEISPAIAAELEAAAHVLAEVGKELEHAAPAAEDTTVEEHALEPLVSPFDVIEEPAPKQPTPVTESLGEPDVATSPAEARLADDDLEVVSIDDDEGDIDLPHLNLHALTGETPPPVIPEGDVTIGGQTLSRGLYDLFMVEAGQHLDTLRAELAALAEDATLAPGSSAVRAAHTLAGISGTARIEAAYALSKALEHSLHRLCDVSQPPTREQLALQQHALDVLENMLDEVAVQSMPMADDALVEELDNLQPIFFTAADLAPAPTAEPEAPQAAVPQSIVVDDFASATPAVVEETPKITVQDELDDQLLPIFFEEADELSSELGTVVRQIRAEPADAAPVQALARLLHTLKGSARMAGAMRLGEYVHSLESRLEKGVAAGTPLADDMENGLDHIGAMLNALRNPGAPEPAAPSTGTATGAAATAIVVAAPVAAATAEDTDTVQGTRSTLRVRADAIDRFVNEAGEISIARTRIEGEMRTLRRSLLDLTENVIRLRNQLREIEIQAESQMQSRLAAAEAHHGEFDPLEFDRFTRLQEVTRMMAESVGDVTTIQQNLLRNLDQSDSALHSQARLSRDLQQALMAVRMVPFEDSADRLYRVVRQTAKELGKRANLDIRNGRIEIDRGVLDKMIAPIEHLLRNAIAHGIESPADRVAAGKPEFGQITLTLSQLSNEIALEIRDDGRGLNYERILARGRSVGLVGPDETPAEARLTQLIFEPGFSTAETVSGVAGRGVGMDVVKSETLAVGGRIDIASSAGQGARFMIRLPLTLAVTQALLVRTGGRTYAIPSNMVEQALELKEPALDDMRSRGFAEWNNEQYPFRYMPRLLGDTVTQPTPNRFHWVLLLRAGNETLAMHIDELRGNQEIIVKNAGPQFVRLQGFTGATVLPDGEIALILNPVVLASRTTAQAQEGAEGAAPVAPQAEEARTPTVMVVDDSLTVRKITSRLLEREGYHVVTAKDGVDALEQLVEMKPDVMLLDIEMPRMDGFDLARNVRADERLRDLPIIMITSRMADKHRNYATEIGVNHYLGKPYQEDVLLELIHGFVGSRH